MRKVFSNADQTIHAFAQQTNNPNAGGRSGNVYFDGVRLYSYGRHYELARYLDNDTVLINDKGYSVTTAKHISKARHGLSQYRQFFASHCESMAVRIQLEGIREKLQTARKPEKYVNEAMYLIDKYNEWKKYHEENRERLAYTLPNYPADLPIIAEFLSLFGAVDFTERLKAQRDAEKKWKANAAQSFKEAFRNFEPFEAYRNLAKLPYSLIRINGENIETSQFVTIPLDEARKAWELYKLGKIRNGDKVGEYSVISANDIQIRIGCHLLNVTDLQEVLG
jgi:hypothetical protein